MELTIKHTSRVIYATLPDGSKAFIRYSVENGVMNLEETYTPPQHRGKGIAGKLMEYALSLAEKKNWLVKPICSYSIYYFIKHPEKRYLVIPEYRNMSEEEWKKLFKERLEKEKEKNKQ
ncbi:MAG: GNAT family N-acetyltransferase [Thermoprotei archaeon]